MASTFTKMLNSYIRLPTKWKVLFLGQSFLTLGLLKSRYDIIGIQNATAKQRLSLKTCSFCGSSPSPSPSSLKLCGACGKVAYCNEKCQTEAWPTHRLGCEGTNVKRQTDDAATSSGSS